VREDADGAISGRCSPAGAGGFPASLHVTPTAGKNEAVARVKTLIAGRD
jgi:hypothetical protein